MANNNLLEFVCDAQKLKDAIEATSQNYVVFIPNTNYLVLTNSTMQDEVTAFSVLSKECFSSYKLKDKIDPAAFEDNEVAEGLPTYAMETSGLTTILSRLKGEVAASIIEVDDTMFMIVADKTVKSNEKHDGKLVLLDDLTVEETLRISVSRKRGRFIEMLDDKNFAIPRTAIKDRNHIIVKLKEDAQFDPILPGSTENMTQVSMWQNKQGYKIRVHTVTETGNNFTSDFSFSEIVQNLLEPVEDNQGKTRFKFPTTPAILERVIKSHKGYISYVFIAELGPDLDLPFLVMFCSKKDYEKGTLYTSSTLSFVQEMDDDIDVSLEEEEEEEETDNLNLLEDEDEE